MDLYKDDYPQNEIEFDEKFNTEEACHGYLFRLRWPDGFVCPKCGHTKRWKNSKSLYECQRCHTQTSITAGTIMHGTRKPLKYWFKAMWWFSVTKTGVNAVNLQKLLGFKSYGTAWTWLQKLRRCTVRIGRSPLSGSVEVDEIYVGGKGEEIRGRGAEKKVKVAVAVERKDGKLGRIRMQVIEDCSADSLIPFITDNISPGSDVITDGWTGYLPLKKEPYSHTGYSVSRSESDASELLPGVHIVASLFKRHYYGTFQGNIDSKHFQQYLDEFVFRFNRRTSKWIGKKFMRIIQQAVTTPNISLRQIVGMA